MSELSTDNWPDRDFIGEVLFYFQHQSEQLGWNKDLRFYADCSDVFHWATSDVEYITIETLPILREAYDDLMATTGRNDWIGELYCCRVRKMRPQGAMYKYLPDILKPLFDACGPDRDHETEDKKASLWNPKARSEFP
ncbi:MAG TPA: hypothetical protein VHK27_03190 [Gammaproteobacteria bacterium]|nr:hypothetical protein [Gammaproteobacteria bacterium]